MSKRKAYRPKPITLDPFRKALAQKAVLTADEKGVVMREARPAFERLRQGRADRQDWAYLADAANVGEALANLGICSDPESKAQAGASPAAGPDGSRRRRGGGSAPGSPRRRRSRSSTGWGSTGLSGGECEPEANILPGA